MTRTVRVLTWNVHRAIGMDGVCDFSRVVDHVAAAEADIVALQEVEGRNRGAKSPPMRILQDRLGHEAVEAASISAPDGKYGQVLLCRWPLRGVQTLDLSFGRWEPRRAISALATTPIGDVRIIATHLGLRFGERSRQVEALCASIDDAHPTILMGDFNDWFRYRSVQQALEQWFPSRTVLRTFPARAPVLALDRIYCRPAGMLSRAWTVRSKPLLSDHLPLLAEFRGAER
jgi:endonuclease/exonuclease/phosphatase family metal-dependent hydrolase